MATACVPGLDQASDPTCSMNFSMSAEDDPIRCDHEEAVVEFVGLPVLFRTRQEEGHVQLGCESGHVRHPRVGLWQDPLRSDIVGKGIAGDNEFGRDDPGCAELCGGGDRRFDKPPIPCEVAWDRSEVEQRDAQGVCRHSLTLSGWSEQGCAPTVTQANGRVLP